ncbi:IS5 family transposase [Paracoccus aerodenitrificans]|uniref:IS5 family transposase n=1 Tax=Paracoccus aerodenitrificans TaxID=3017781 RepID=UPI003EBE2AD1
MLPPIAGIESARCPSIKHEFFNKISRRGDVTIWIEDGTAGKWSAPKRKGRGGRPKYSDFAIETCLTLGLIFHQPLRQTQGFVRSLLGLMGVELPVPDFSTLSRRTIGLSVVDDRPKSSGPVTLIVDSTGLKIHRGSGWQEVKHGTGKTRKSWRKLHIGYDPDSGEIIASLLTIDQVGDETALPELIAGIETPVARILADGAYDGTGVSNCLSEAFGPDVEITIPPPITAVPGLSDRRDAHIEHIAEHGRMAWQSATGYNARALVEAQIGRRKFVIGPRLNAREMDRQITENKITTKSLNRMTRIGRAVFKRVA